MKLETLNENQIIITLKAVFGKSEHIKEKMAGIENFSFAFFVPIYFALVGIQLNVVHDFSFLRFVIFFVTAFLLEFAEYIVCFALCKNFE